MGIKKYDINRIGRKADLVTNLPEDTENTTSGPVKVSYESWSSPEIAESIKKKIVSPKDSLNKSAAIGRKHSTETIKRKKHARRK